MGLLPALWSVLWGRARWRQLERGRPPGKVSGKDVICGRANRAPVNRLGTESPKETPDSLTTHQGLGWRPSGERKLQIPRALVCFLLYPDVVGARTSWEAPGGSGEGPTAPSVAGERAEVPSSATCFSSISRSSFLGRTFSESWPQRCTCQLLRLFSPLFLGPFERSWLMAAGPQERSAARVGVQSPPAWLVFHSQG